jgi:N-acetylglucosaminyl-diphospho-decaprenol L-rhamnosyltransferase
LKPLPVSIIIVTYNSAHCIGQALAAAPRAAELIVVDNASSDDTIEQAQKFSCTVVANRCNVGFGAACNQGAKIADREFLLFLNPDAILAPNVLELLLIAATNRPDAAGFGPKLMRDPNAVKGWPAAADGHAEGAGAVNQAAPGYRQVSFISGASFLCRRSVFFEVGGFDEKFFLYFEDEDLCLRLASHGALIEVEEAVVFHHPGRGAGLDTRQRFSKYRHYGHSRAYFCKKHGVPYAFGLSALEQTGKGLIAMTLAQTGRAAQHFGRAVGYVEGRLRHLRFGRR